MSSTFYMRLRSTAVDDPVEGCLLQDGVPTATGTMPLEDLARRAEGMPCVVFIPAAETLSTAVTLPPMSAAKARAALPYALEDQLAGDLESQHFASGARLADGRWPVRVIARVRLEAWLQRLRGAGIEPRSLCAVSDALRDKPGDLMLWLDGEDAHWRAPGSPTVTLPADLLTEGPAAALGGTPAGVLGLRVHGSVADLARHSGALDSLGAGFLQTVTQALPEPSLPWLVAQHEAGQSVNLLQGEHAARPRSAMTLDGWRWPLRLAAVVAALQLIGWGLEAWRMQRAAAPVDAALLAAARPLDPALQDPDAARSQLRARLEDWDRRERDPAGAPLIAPLATLADARAAVPALQLRALQQQASGAVIARLGVDDAPALQSARQMLLAAGWTLSAESADELTLAWSPQR